MTSSAYLLVRARDPDRTTQPVHGLYRILRHGLCRAGGFSTKTSTQAATKVSRGVFWGFVGACLLATSVAPLRAQSFARAQAEEGPRILFLHLQLTNQTVLLVSTNARPGVLKPQPDSAQSGLQYELLSASGELLWRGRGPDPTVRHLEYEDPPGSGKLVRKLVQLPGAEFTIRVPLLAGAKRVAFYKLEPQAATNKAALSPARKPLGSISLP